MGETSAVYFVETPSGGRRELLCRWAEHLYMLNKRVRIATDSTLAAQHLDQLLWTFDESSFTPHRVAAHLEPFAETSNSIPAPVLITVGEAPPRGSDEALLCDSPMSLEYMTLFSLAVHYILLDDPERKQESRLLWQNARERGLRTIHVPRASNAPEKSFPPGS
jgi:DNA polymerase-3 subunit chi